LDFFGRPLMTITNYTTPWGLNASDSPEFLEKTSEPDYPTILFSENAPSRRFSGNPLRPSFSLEISPEKGYI
jgi:hypothetical protein